MKAFKIIGIIAGVLAAWAAVWYFFFYKAAAPLSNTTTAGGPAGETINSSHDVAGNLTQTDGLQPLTPPLISKRDGTTILYYKFTQADGSNYWYDKNKKLIGGGSDADILAAYTPYFG